MLFPGPHGSGPAKGRKEMPMPTTGRAPRADGVATRARILEEAGQRIAAAGFAQTTNKEIAVAAAVDLASINHHFGNRAGLYQAVLAEAHRRFLDAELLERLVASPKSAKEKLRAMIGLMVEGRAQAQRWPMIVLAREILSPSSHLPTLQQQEVLPKLQLVLPILSELTAIPMDSPVLWRCLPCIAAPCAIYALARHLDSPLTNRLGHPRESEVADHLFTFALGGLENVSRAFLRGNRPV